MAYIENVIVESEREVNQNSHEFLLLYIGLSETIKKAVHIKLCTAFMLENIIAFQKLFLLACEVVGSLGHQLLSLYLTC